MTKTSGGGRAAVIGMGGFAGEHHKAIRELEAQGLVKLVCTCDPKVGEFREQQASLQFAERGIRVFDDYREMLKACAGELDWVTIPTPIPLHAPMHKACVDHGLPVYLEKPPTCSWSELEQMLDVERRATQPTNVGFNFIVETRRQQIKGRIVEGEFGRIRRVLVTGLTPRMTSYYGRASWAGRLRLGESLVLDSPMGNAMAHDVHNGLFWAGQDDLWAWGGVQDVESELYRAHAIEGMDTVFLRARMADGVLFDLAMSHACSGAMAIEERVECERATISIDRDPETGVHRYLIARGDGRTESLMEDAQATLKMNLECHARFLRGDRVRPLTLLEDSRPFVALNGLAYLASGKITPVPARDIETVPCPAGQGQFKAIRGLRELVAAFATDRQFPSERGVAWALPSGAASAAQLQELEARMAAFH